MKLMNINFLRVMRVIQIKKTDKYFLLKKIILNYLILFIKHDLNFAKQKI